MTRCATVLPERESALTGREGAPPWPWPPAPAQRRDPRRGRARGRRLAGDGLPRRQRLPQGQPRGPRAPSRPPSTELGYIPNRAARSLVTRRSDSIAVVITEPTGRLFSDPFFPRLLRGISSRARRPRPAARPAHAASPPRRPSGRRDYLTGRPRRRRAARQPPRRRPAARAGSRRRASRSWSVGRPPRGAGRELRRRRQPPAARGRAVEHLIAGGRRVDRHDHRTRGHGRRASTGSTATATRSTTRPRRSTRRSRRPATSPRRAAPPRWSDSSQPAPTSTRSSPRPTSWPPARWPSSRPPADGSPRTSPSSASTTRRSPSHASPRLTSVRQPIEEMGREMARLLLEHRRGTGSRASGASSSPPSSCARLERREARALSRPATGGVEPTPTQTQTQTQAGSPRRQ